MIDLAISPCPNDTFIFYNMHRLHPEIELVFADVEELNHRALVEARHALTKMSFYAVLKAERYTLLSCGGALGQGGPILLSGSAGRIEDLTEILIPGPNTTACLLLDLFLSEHHPDPASVKRTSVRYDRILPLLADGAQAGVVIHEERFTYPSFGVRAMQDLGDWWGKETGLPIPLGGICARKDLGPEFAADSEKMIRESLSEAWKNPDSTKDFVKCYSQSLEDSVIRQHIDLFVNDYSMDLGEKGRQAVAELKRRARSAGLVPA